MIFRTLRFATIWAAAAAATLVCMSAGDAAAFWEGVAPSGCTGVTGSGSLILAANGHITGAGTVLCPFQEDSDHPHENVSSINVYLYDSTISTNVTAKACVATFPAVGALCGTPTSSSGTGFKNIHPSVSAWTANPSYYAYVHITLPSGASHELAGVSLVF